MARSVFEASESAHAARIADLKDALSAERDRLTAALAAIEAMKVAGGGPSLTPTLDIPTQDPIQAAIIERAKAYPIRMRRAVMARLGESAMKRRASGEDDANILAHIASGVAVEEGVPA